MSKFKKQLLQQHATKNVIKIKNIKINYKKPKNDLLFINKKKQQQQILIDIKKENRRRGLVAYRKIVFLVQSSLDAMTDVEQKKKFLKKYAPYLKKIPHSLNYLIKPPSDAVLKKKLYKKINRKRFAFLVKYKLQRLHTEKQNKVFWSFFEEKKLKQFGNCSSVEWHPQRIYTLRRVFRYYYGYLKNTIWKKAYYYSKKKKNRILSFLHFLENRISILIFRMNFVLNLLQGKQLIRHGFIFVNKRKITFFNFSINPKDIISIDKKSFIKFILENEKNYKYSRIGLLKMELPHLYIKYRIITGMILYNPVQNFNLTFQQYPKIFFDPNYKERRKNEIPSYSRKIKVKSSTFLESNKKVVLNMYEKFYKNIFIGIQKNNFQDFLKNKKTLLFKKVFNKKYNTNSENIDRTLTFLKKRVEAKSTKMPFENNLYLYSYFIKY